MAIEIAKAKLAVNPESNPGDPAYLKIRDLVYRISGIYHPEEKLYLLSSRCGRRMAALGVASPSEYLEHLTTRGNRTAELRLLLNEMHSLKSGRVQTSLLVGREYTPVQQLKWRPHFSKSTARRSAFCSVQVAPLRSPIRHLVVT